MSFIENDKDLNQESAKYEVIVASEKSQALLDLINNHKICIHTQSITTQII